jgi:hypothetical protein
VGSVDGVYPDPQSARVKMAMLARKASLRRSSGDAACREMRMRKPVRVFWE